MRAKNWVRCRSVTISEVFLKAWDRWGRLKGTLSEEGREGTCGTTEAR